MSFLRRRMAKKNYKIENIEYKFQQAGELLSTITIDGEEGTDIISTKYIGEVLSYQVNPNVLEWDVSFKKKVQKVNFKEKKKRREKDITEIEKTVWEINTLDRYNNSNDITVIMDGEIHNDRTNIHSYRYKLVSKLADRKVTVSRSLLNEIFGPLEEKMMEIYNKVKTFE